MIVSLGDGLFKFQISTLQILSEMGNAMMGRCVLVGLSLDMRSIDASARDRAGMMNDARAMNRKVEIDRCKLGMGAILCRLVSCIWCVCLTMLATGCSQGPSYAQKTKQDLMLLGLEIHNAKPTNQEELETRSADAKQILGSQNYVYLPGIDMNLSNWERSQFIVAYHKDTPTLGGYALSGDGSVISYTKEKFAAAQKWDPKAAAKGTEEKAAGEKPAEEEPVGEKPAEVATPTETGK